MTRDISKIIAATILWIMWISCSSQGEAQEGPATAKVMVAQAEQIMRGNSNQMRMEMHVVTPNWNRAYVLASWMQGRDKTLIRVLDPVKRRGEGYLNLRTVFVRRQRLTSPIWCQTWQWN